MKDKPDTSARAKALSIIDRELRDQDRYQGGALVLLKRLWRDYLRPHRKRLIAALIAAIIGSCTQLCFPFTIRFLFDKVLLAGPITTADQMHHRVMLACLYFAACCGIWSVMLSSQWVRSFLILRLGQRLVYNLRRDLNEKLHNLHIGFFERTPAGRIMSRLLDDVDMIRRWCTNRFVDFLAGLARLIIGAGLAFYLNWKMALIALLVMPFFWITIQTLRPRVRRANIAQRRLNSAMYARAAERINGIGVIRAFGRERGELSDFAETVHDNVRVANRLVVYNQGMSFVAGSISALATGVVIYLAATGVRQGTMSIGDLLAFQRLLHHMFDPIQQLATLFIQFQALLVVLNRVFNLLDEKVDVVPGTRILDKVDWPVRLEKVSLVYPNQQSPAIEDVTFEINRNERIAIMGPSGCGKSSVFQLLLRFYDPTHGTIRVGDRDLRDFFPGSVRRRICMVQQEPFIFSGTLRSNIPYGRPDASQARIEEAAKLAELHDFIQSLPQGYDTEVGERGISLSGGQRQRLALATALLSDPDILLLDDITSSLDAETELRIRETLQRSLTNRTSLIITQRIAMACECDRIIVMDEGRIEAMGTHAELKKKEGFYRMICEKQDWA